MKTYILQDWEECSEVEFELIWEAGFGWEARYLQAYDEKGNEMDLEPDEIERATEAVQDDLRDVAEADMYYDD